MEVAGECVWHPRLSITNSASWHVTHALRRASDSNLAAYTYFFFPLSYHLVHVSLYLGTFSRVPRDLITGAQVGVLHHTHPSPTGNEEEESPELISALPFHFFNFFGKHVFISKILNVSKSGRLELHSDNFELELYLRIIC